MQVMKRLSLATATATCLSFLVFIYVHLNLSYNEFDNLSRCITYAL